MDFFRRYKLIMGCTYVTLVGIAAAAFWVQLRDKERAELAHIGDRLREHALILDALALMAADEVAELRREAEHAMAAGAGLPAEARIVQAGSDFMAEPDPRDAVAPGGLSGSGDFLALDARTRREVSTALGLTRLFAAAERELPMVREGFYLSASRFRSAYPAERAEPFQAAHPSSEALALGMPERNPSRQPYWTRARTDAGEPSVTVAAPVYAAGAFLGVVGLELGLGYFGQVNADFSYPSGETFLVSDHGQVVAHPRADLTAGPVAGLPESQAVLVGRLADLPPRTMVTLENGLLAQHQRLRHAPWTLVYAVPRSEILLGLAFDRGLQALLLLGVLTAMLVVANRLTRHEFIEPARLLVQHIAAAGRGAQTAMPRVPPSWLPWFRTIDRIFRENAELAGLRQELEIARRMQLSILPSSPPVHPAFTIHGQTKPAKEVGGDFYDYFLIDEHRLGFTVADVSGKGVPAALFMMISRTLEKATAMSGLEPGECIRRVNNMLCGENEQMMFVTVFYGVLDLRTGALSYANAGHNPPFILGNDGSVVRLPMTNGTALGVMEDLEYEQAEVRLRPGDSVFLYTDGLYGGAGNDSVIGGGDADRLYGESGDDQLHGG
ncbi:MAG TPA: SpoIIE family protein phosphatase, partial [Alphaproteobacteria bacterium]|nr:SpoIIE family protein phosphatase [Alphaproteobacteria bacterium]